MLLVTCLLALVGAGGATARDTGEVFYLSVHPRQCLIKPATQGVETDQVVPCSNPAHNLEVYWVGHGGWGHRNPPSNALAYAHTACLGAFARLTGHALPRTSGWEGFWPDPGPQAAKYGDKLICSLRSWPGFHALGAGWHVR